MQRHFLSLQFFYPLKGLLGQKSKLIFWAPDIKTMKLHLQSPNIHLVFQISDYGNVNALKKEEISPTCLCLNNRFPDTNFICQKRYHHSIVETAVIAPLYPLTYLNALVFQ